MNFRRFNWPLWLGFLLVLIAVFSYPAVFVWSPVTRDFPWVNLLLFVVALVFVWQGIRRGFARDRKHPAMSKVVTSIFATLSVAFIALFIFSFFVFARWLPSSTNAPHAGAKAPEFTLADSNGKQVSLHELLSTPLDGRAPKGALLVFYRGYW
jgi:hypothetical protein